MLEADDGLPWSAWAMRPAALAELVAEVRRGRRQVVECGSGVSTLVLARALQGTTGHLDSLEHDPEWARLVRSALAREGLEAQARVIVAPLRPHPLAPGGGEWYAAEALDELPASGVDLLLVDGPPAGEPEIERRRYPALPALQGRLAPEALVVLDDAARAGESWVLDAWERETEFRFERLVEERIALGRRARPPA